MTPTYKPEPAISKKETVIFVLASYAVLAGLGVLLAWRG